MNTKKYILLERIITDSSFIMGNQYYEIYFLNNFIDEIADNDNIIVNASNQIEAFKKFRETYSDLYKISEKDFKEIPLILNVE